jgi:hypothetical protein
MREGNAVRLGNRELLEMEKIAKTAGIAKECRLEMQNLELQKSKTPNHRSHGW